MEKLSPAYSQAEMLRGQRQPVWARSPLDPRGLSAGDWGYPKGGRCEGEDVWHRPPESSQGRGLQRSKENACERSPGQRTSARLPVSCLCPDFFSLGTPPPPQAKYHQLYSGQRARGPSFLGCLQVPAPCFRGQTGIYTENRKMRKVVSG